MDQPQLNRSQDFMDRIHIPPEAQTEFYRAETQLRSSERDASQMAQIKSDFDLGQIGFKEAIAQLKTLSDTAGLSEYTLYFYFLILCSDVLHEKYRARGIEDQIFWDTMDDLRCKLLECYEVKGVWGTFVVDWYEGFLTMERFALGRFQYEEKAFEGEPFTKNGITVNPKDIVYNFHIPSSGQPIDHATRYDSYRKAYEFYGCKQKGKPLILVCDSWLLSAENEKFLPSDSNILAFIRDFDMISNRSYDTFSDSWRVFGKHHTLPVEQRPVDTKLRKSVVQHLLNGGQMGYGYGLIIFDGEKII